MVVPASSETHNRSCPLLRPRQSLGTHPPPRRGLGGGSGLEMPAKQAGVEMTISVVRVSGVRRMACEFSEFKNCPYSFISYYSYFPIGPNLLKFLKLLNLSNAEFTLTFLLRLRLPPHIPSGRVPISRQTWRMR